MGSCFSSSRAAITDENTCKKPKSAQPVQYPRFSSPKDESIFFSFKQNKTKNGFHLKAFENIFDATEA